MTGVGIPSTVFERGLEHAKHSADRWETMFSRFRPESELQPSQSRNGRPTQVSDDFIGLAVDRDRRCPLDRWPFQPGHTDSSLESLGYDRTFAEVGEPDSATTSSPLS